MMRVLKQWPLLLTAVTILINLEQAGETVGWSSPIIAYLTSKESPIPITSDEGSWIVSMLPLVSVFFTPLSALSMHYLGRKTPTVLATIPYLISWAIIAFATSYTQLIIARVVQGIAISISYTVTPVYLAEISPDNHRGSIGICMTVIGYVGVIWVYWVGTFPKLWLSSLLSALPIFIILIFAIWLPESPYYLLSQNRREDAVRELRKIRNKFEVENEIRQIELTVASSNTGNSFIELFTKENHRKALFIVIGTVTFAQFTGVVALQFYAHSIFNKIANVSANTLSMAKAVLDLVSSLISASIIDKYGKRPLLMISCVGSFIFMAAIGVYFYLLDNNYSVDVIWWLPLVSMALFDFCNVIGIYSIYLAFFGEFFHPKVKSVGVCIAKMYMALAILAVGKLFQVLTDTFGNSIPFFCFSIIGLLGIAFVQFCVPETKNRSLEDIQYYLKNKAFKPNLLHNTIILDNLQK